MKQHHRPPRNPVDRLQRFTDHMVPARTAAIMTTRLPDMQFGMKRYLPIEASIRSKVGAILQPTAVPQYKIGQYQAAALELWRLQQKFKGQSKADIALILAKWTARGLSATYLGTIRDIVTGIAAP